MEGKKKTNKNPNIPAWLYLLPLKGRFSSSQVPGLASR